MAYFDGNGKCRTNRGKFAKRAACSRDRGSRGVGDLGEMATARGRATATRLQDLARDLGVGRFVEFNPAGLVARYIMDGTAIGSTAREAEATIRRKAHRRIGV